MKRISQTGDRRNLVTLAELRHKRVRLTIPFTAPVIAGAGRVLADGSAVVLPLRDGSTVTYFAKPVSFVTKWRFRRAADPARLSIAAE